jgi:PAS domain-containing protein
VNVVPTVSARILNRYAFVATDRAAPALMAIDAVAPPPFDRRVRYERVLAATRQIVIEHDPSTGAVVCAGAVERLLGRSPEELVTLDAVLARFAEPDREALAAAFAQARTAADPIAVSPRAGAFELAGDILRDGDGVVAILRDVTAQRLAERALDRHAQHALLVGEIGDALTRTTSSHAMLQQCAEMLVTHLDAALARI